MGIEIAQTEKREGGCRDGRKSIREQGWGYQDEGQGSRTGGVGLGKKG